MKKKKQKNVLNNDDNEVYGVIEVPSSPNEQNFKLIVGLSLSAKSLYDSHGSLYLIESQEAALARVKKGQNIKYRLNFPSFLPSKVTKIVFNGKEICSGPSEEGSFQNPITSVELQHSFGRPKISLGTENKFELPTFGPEIAVERNDLTEDDDFCGEPTISGNPLVVNGSPIVRGEFPWLVALYWKNAKSLEYKCSGTLISDKIVLTSAHCLFVSQKVISEEKIVLFAGRNDIDDWSEGGFISPKVKQFIIHADYNSTTADADIAILLLQEKLEFTQFIRPACLWKNTLKSNDQSGFVAGWGRDSSGKITSTPNKVEMPIVSEVTCLRSHETFRFLTSSRTFCAGKRDGSGPCNGDSGGGFLMKINKKWYLRGIVSTSLYDEDTNSCDSSGSIQLINSKEATFGEIKQGQEIKYRLNFPTFLPTVVTKILFNDKEICSGPPVKGSFDNPVTSMDLQHSFVIPSEIKTTSSGEFTINRNTEEHKKPTFNASENSDDDCGVPVKAVTPLIYNGSPTNRGEFPWLVVIYVKKARALEFQCGGTLISKRLILTAAHCIHQDDNILSKSEIVLHVGRFDIDDWAEGDYAIPKIKDIICHPDYKQYVQTSYDADIALITLFREITFTPFVRSICLWNSKQHFSSNTGTIVGWGRDESGEPTSTPNKLEMPIVSDKTCLSSDLTYKYLTSNRTFCAGKRDGSGPCNGDSGGGFMSNEGGKWYLRGIVSTSLYDEETKSCDVRNYAVFTDVEKFLPWIQNYL
ncbi:transmembrane protease serine 9-like [Culicoides brevitarsis]|uniref:transmembrane protease serine 9-like n=1 Tax=Culicoides brevitarsis TaxID=469753 RepID=UPI00307BD43F